MVVDCITYNGEKDLFDLRYNILKDHVDQFIVVEFDKTFTGKDKPQYFQEIAEKYEKVKYCWHPEGLYLKYKELAESSPNTKGADHWKLEFMQKESIKDCLTHLQDDDIVFVGDCDEIWDHDLFKRVDGFFVPRKIKLKVYSYYLNNRSDEEFWGTFACRYSLIKDAKIPLNHWRSSLSQRGGYEDGWHFTNMGGEAEIRRKLNDSYTPESYNTPWVQEHLKENIAQRKDYIGRDFKMKIEESRWPEFLKNNKEKYKHLCV